MLPKGDSGIILDALYSKMWKYGDHSCTLCKLQNIVAYFTSVELSLEE